MVKEIKFYEKSHKYKIGTTELTSVTTFLKDYFSPFDVDKIAKIKAMISRRSGEKGKGVRYWKASWKASAEHGTRVHRALEEFILYKETRSEYLEVFDAKKIDRGINFIKDNILGVERAPEKIIFDEELGLAGTIDLMVKNKDGTISLFDWKTNNKISFTAYRNQKAKEPINDLPDCNWTKYSLQLCLYAYMLERQGYKIKDLTLVHLADDYVKPLKVAYNKELIEKVLKHGKETNEKGRE